MANQLFELLKKDHQEVKQIMQKISQGSRQQCETLFVELNDELTVHMQLEEKLFLSEAAEEPGMQAVDAGRRSGAPGGEERA